MNSHFTETSRLLDTKQLSPGLTSKFDGIRPESFSSSGEIGGAGLTRLVPMVLSLGILLAGIVQTIFFPIYMQSFDASLNLHNDTSPVYFVLISASCLLLPLWGVCYLYLSLKRRSEIEPLGLYANWSFYLPSGFYTGFGVILMASAATELPPVVQALSLGNICLFLVLIQFLTNKTAPLHCVHLLPLPSACLVCVASIVSVGEEFLKYFNGEVPFLETYLVRYLQFNAGLLFLSGAYIINEKFMKLHVVESEFTGKFVGWTQALVLKFWCTFFQVLSYLFLFWMEYVPTIGYSRFEGNILQVWNDFRDSLECFFGQSCNRTWFIGLMFYIAVIVFQLLTLTLSFRKFNLVYLIPLHLISGLSVCCWLVADNSFFGLAFPSVPLWASSASLFVYLIGNAGLSYALYLRKNEPSGEVEPEMDRSHLNLHGDTAATNSSRPTCPIDHVSFLSHITFTWLAGIMSVGYSRPLTQADIWSCPPIDESRMNANLFMAAWENEMQRLPGDRSLIRAFIYAYWRYFILGIFTQISFLVLDVVGPYFLLRRLLQFYETPQASSTQGWILIAVLVVVQSIQVLCRQYSFHNAKRVGQRIRAAYVIVIAEKIFRLKPENGPPIGDIISMASTDASIVAQMILWFHFGWSVPPFILLIFIVFGVTLGVPGFVGMLVICLTFPLQALLAKFISYFRVKFVEQSSMRIKMTSDLLSSIAIVKQYSWDEYFINLISKRREEEVKWIKYSSYVNFLNTTISVAMPSLATAVSLSLYVALGYGELTSSVAFSTVALYNVMRVPLINLPFAVRSMSLCLGSFARLQDFLELPEFVEKRLLTMPKNNDNDSGSMRFTQIDTNADLAIRSPVKEFDLKKGKESEIIESAIRLTSVNVQFKNVNGVDANDETPILSEDEGIALSDIEESGDEFRMMHSSSGKRERKELPFSLRNINMDLKKGQLVGVFGQVGSGKTSLIRTILGELEFTGSIRISGTLAYVPQQSWLMNTSLRKNVLFLSAMDEEKYISVLRACQLLPDLAQLIDGDQSEIGEQGINLSGGQKQRISLARAVYSDADILLLDDPLSACDQHVGKLIFQECIRGLLREKTVFFVTNQLQYLSQCDSVIFIDGGAIHGSGLYSDLMKSDEKFAYLLAQFANSENRSEEYNDKEEVEGDDIETLVPEVSDSQPVTAESLAGSKEKEITKLMTKEDRKTGTVDSSTWKAFFFAHGMFAFLLLLVLFILVAAGKVFEDWFLSFWVDTIAANQSASSPALTNNDYIGILVGLALANTLILLARGFYFSYSVLSAQEKLSIEVLRRLVGSPLSFFHTTPLGRILNRLSQDQDNVDTLLTDNSLQAFHYGLNSVATILIIIYSIPWFIIVVIPLTVLFVQIRKYNAASGREAKRLESISISPIFANLSNTIQGLATIRSYTNASAYFRRQLEEKTDQLVANTLVNECISRWLALRLDSVGVIVILTTSVFTMLLRSSISTGLAGLAISFSFQMCSNFQRSIRQYSEAENLMTSFERLLFYSQLPQEEEETTSRGERNAPVTGNEKNAMRFIGDTSAVDATWPRAGAISVESVVVRYRRDLPISLSLSIEIRKAEKIGIIGRTGSGKSTFTSVLFRLVSLESGRICIDGVDIKSVPLRVLRDRIAIVPQEPVIFGGSIRSNLDPYERYSDSEVWEVLDRVRLKNYVHSLQDGLLNEAKKVLSVGQSQLLCIARVLLRKNKIVVLDEATASIDNETDQILQESIFKSYFVDCTVITIAHRLHTIIDSDRILVLEAGEAVEFDTPKRLADRGDSFLNRLIAATDSNTAAFLRQSIEESHLAKENVQDSKEVI